MTHSLFGQTCNNLLSVGSDIRRIFLLGQEIATQQPNLEIIDLSLGNPDLEPPKEITEALKSLIAEEKKGVHRYMDNAGYPEVRGFLANELSQELKLPITSHQTFLTCGAAGGLHVLLRALVDPKDEIIIFAPFFVEYVPYTQNYGAIPVIVPSDENHLPDYEKFKNALTEKTKAIIINSPNNPSGVVYQQEVYEKLALIIKEHEERTGRPLHVISDEPYVRLTFSQNQRASPLAAFRHCWLVRSHSKDLGLAGERIGYIAWREDGPLGDPSSQNFLRNAARTTGFVNAPALMQRLLVKVYHTSVNIDEYKKRIDYVYNALTEMGLSCVKPGGSFFIFPKSPMADDGEYCELLVRKGVLAVPGRGFGKAGYFRLSLTQPLPKLEKAMTLIKGTV